MPNNSSGCKFTDAVLHAAISLNQSIESIGKYMITASGLTDDGLEKLCNYFIQQRHSIKVLFLESIEERRFLQFFQDFIKILDLTVIITGFVTNN